MDFKKVGHSLSSIPVRSTLATSTVIIVLIYLAKRRKSLRYPPGPAPIPIFGNIFYLAKHQSNNLKAFSTLAKQYGDIFCIYLGKYRMVVVNNYTLIKEAFVTNNDATDHRPGHLSAIQRCTGAKGMVYQNGLPQRRLRKFAIGSMRDFGVGRQTLEVQIQDEAGHLVAEIEKQNDEAFDPERMLTKAVSNVISSIVFGERNDYDDKHFSWFIDCLQQFFQTTVTHFAENYLPWVKYIWMEKKMKERLAQEDVLQSFLREKITTHEETYNEHNMRDFVDHYIKEKRAGTEHGRFSETDMARLILELYTAGTETTTTTLRWLLLFLVLHTDVQTKCREEMIQVVGESRVPSLSDRDSLPYTNATIKEVMRVGNTAPSSLTHLVNRDITLGGYDVPKGTILIGNLYECHMDPRVWDEPTKFRPERWINQQGKMINREEFIPFSLGRRDCLGEKLAKTELFLFSTALIQKFKFVTSGEALSLDGVVRLTHAPQPFNIKARAT